MPMQDYANARQCQCKTKNLAPNGARLQPFDMISSLLVIISSLAAGIKPLLVSSFTMQNRGTRVPITSPIAQSNASAYFKMVLYVKLRITQRTSSQLVLCFRKTVLDIVLRYRLLNKKHTTDKAVIRSTQWTINEHIYYVREIHHHQTVSVTSNMSVTANCS